MPPSPTTTPHAAPRSRKGIPNSAHENRDSTTQFPRIKTINCSSSHSNFRRPQIRTSFSHFTYSSLCRPSPAHHVSCLAQAKAPDLTSCPSSVCSPGRGHRDLLRMLSWIKLSRGFRGAQGKRPNPHLSPFESKGSIPAPPTAHPHQPPG